jgi:GrpB-like predicted nucleotidyltransferase (UPF0157 family)
VPSDRHPSLDDRLDPAIRVVAHDPRWLVEAASELGRVCAGLGSLVVRAEHIGSTAVPGLSAKPIIDLLVCVVRLEPREPYVERFGRMGYLFAFAPESAGRHFFARPPERPRTHHVHVCEAGGEHEIRHLAVRDFLRVRQDEAEAYGGLKRELAWRNPGDRLAYMAGKDPYLEALEARALQWARTGTLR